jgi:cytoskeletal protein CcmA (bactofilin family)
MADTYTLGEGIQIRGTVTGDGDLTVQGRIEGEIAIGKRLTLASGAVVQASVQAAEVVLSEGASLSGDVRTVRLVIEDGARLSGSIDMEVTLPETLRSKAKEARPTRARA